MAHKKANAAKRSQHKSVDPKSKINKQFDQVVLEWNTAEFVRYEKGNKWHFLMLGVCLLFVLYAVLSGSWSMALVFIVLPVVLTLEHRQKPKAVKARFTLYGVEFGDLKYAYSEIKSFWIHHHPPAMDDLILRTSSKMNPELTIQLAGVSPSLVRNILIRQVPEREGQTPSLIETVIRAMKLN